MNLFKTMPREANWCATLRFQLQRYEKNSRRVIQAKLFRIDQLWRGAIPSLHQQTSSVSEVVVKVPHEELTGSLVIGDGLRTTALFDSLQRLRRDRLFGERRVTLFSKEVFNKRDLRSAENLSSSLSACYMTDRSAHGQDSDACASEQRADSWGYYGVKEIQIVRVGHLHIGEQVPFLNERE